MTGARRDAFARLPQVDAVLRDRTMRASIEAHGHRVVADAVRAVLDDARARIAGGEPPPSPGAVSDAVHEQLGIRTTAGLTEVVNATGVIVHTNLGRAPLPAAARTAVLAAAGYTNLEYDLRTGTRGSRTRHLGELVAEVTGAAAGTVVNNGAGALILVLAALAHGREVVVSRGELIEIGGSYRLPDIMEAAGVELVEVGTTNRTRLEDYRTAIGDDTALLLKVHRSNYRVIGFTEEAGPDELATLATRTGIPFVHDLGSGLLQDVPTGPLAREPSVAASLRAGSDLVLFSGDKLLGGPQAGIVAGRTDLVAACTRHPLARALRVDKLQRAALEATLQAHLRDPVAQIPVLTMLSVDPDELRGRAHVIAEALGDDAVAVSTEAVVGGGSLPGVSLPSWAVRLASPTVDQLAAALRRGDPPVIARVEEGDLLLDLRTVPASMDGELIGLVRAARD